MKRIFLLFSCACAIGLQSFATTVIEPGVKYYMRNVANGKYFSIGAYYGTHAIVSESAAPITFEATSETNSFKPRTSCGYLQQMDIYVDKGMDYQNPAVWTPELQNDGKTFVFTYMYDGKQLAVGMDGDLYVNQCDYNKDDKGQQWEVFTWEEMIGMFDQASVENPVEATFLIEGASIIPNSSENAKWVRSDAGANALFEYAEVTSGNDWRRTQAYKSYNAATEDGASTRYTITNLSTSLPAGQYLLTCQAVSDGATPVLTINGTKLDYPKVGDNGDFDAIVFGDRTYNGEYKSSMAPFIADGNLEIKFVKGDNTNATVLYFDNFKLYYIGKEKINEYELTHKNVKNAMEDAKAIADKMGLIDFDNSEVLSRWTNHEIKGDGEEEVLLTYEALAKAVKAQTAIPADMTYAVINPSFEHGTLGWTFTSGGDTGIKESTGGNTTDGCDGKYYFNTWHDAKGHPVSQVLKDMPAGKYKVSVKASAEGGKTLYLTVNDKHNSVVIPEGERMQDTFQNIEMEYTLPEKGDMKIGVAGGNDSTGELVPDNGAWYRTDNFNVTRVAANPASGVEILEEVATEAVEYYNLQGMKVVNPVKGQIYIMRQGRKAVKKVF